MASFPRSVHSTDPEFSYCSRITLQTAVLGCTSYHQAPSHQDNLRARVGTRGWESSESFKEEDEKDFALLPTPILTASVNFYVLIVFNLGNNTPVFSALSLSFGFPVTIPMDVFIRIWPITVNIVQCIFLGFLMTLNGLEHWPWNIHITEYISGCGGNTLGIMSCLCVLKPLYLTSLIAQSL